MSREHQPNSPKPLELRIAGLPEKLFQEIFKVGVKSREDLGLRELAGIASPRSPLPADYNKKRQVIIHQTEQAPEHKNLFTHQTILFMADCVVAGREIYDPEAILQVNGELISENLEEKESVEKLAEALRLQGYKAKLYEVEDEFSEEDPLWSIEIDFPNVAESAVQKAFISFDGKQVSIKLEPEGLHFDASYGDEVEYKLRIAEVNDALEKLLRLVEAFSIALAETFAISPPVPQTINITLPS